jgi:uncharacterized protein YbjT (DUF2867 family)
METVRSPAAGHELERSRLVVLVLGGTGFIGRHVVAALADRPCAVVVGSRRPERNEEPTAAAVPSSDPRRLNFAQLLTPADWREQLGGIDVVINCVGILRQRGRETYERVHHLAPAALAMACRELGLRFIHVSALGLDASARSRFLRSKLAGEAAIRDSGADWRIVRPSLLDGEGGFGASWLRRVARWPLQPVPADAVGRIAALDVRDLGQALAGLALNPDSSTDAVSMREFDLGGLDERNLAEHLLALRRLSTSNGAWQLRFPSLLARLGSHVCDLLHLTPYSYGHWELLRRGNCPAHNRLPELLGRSPLPVGKSQAARAPTSGGAHATPSWTRSSLAETRR